MTVQEYVDEFENEQPEFIERINKKFEFILNLLLKVYIRPEEVLRELDSNAIAFEIPNPAGYDFIEQLFKGKFKEPDIGFL